MLLHATAQPRTRSRRGLRQPLRRAVAAAALLLVAGAAGAATINFDGLADGTVVNGQYSGVSLINPVGGGNVYARAWSGGNNVVSIHSAVSGWAAPYNAQQGAVDASFATPQRSVSIDAAPFLAPENFGTAIARPYLQAFDSAGNLLATVYYQGALPNPSGTGPIETLTYVSPIANIARVRFTVQGGTGGAFVRGIFDNLSYSTTTTPTATVYDNFSSTNGRWTASTTGSGVSTGLFKGSLRMVIDATASGSNGFSGVWAATCRLGGDFDIQTDYFTDGQTLTGVRLALNAPGAGHIERTSLSRTDFYTAGEYYITSIAGYWPGFVSTRDTSGKLRLARSGNQMTSYYQSAGSTTWVPVYTQAVTTSDLPFQLQAWSGAPAFDGRTVVVRFDNVILNRGRFVGAGCP